MARLLGKAQDLFMCRPCSLGRSFRFVPYSRDKDRRLGSAGMLATTDSGDTEALTGRGSMAVGALLVRTTVEGLLHARHDPLAAPR
jgi:hypothetical protein